MKRSLLLLLPLVIFAGLQSLSQNFGTHHQLDPASNEWTLLKYLGKHDVLKGRPEWDNNPYVKQVRKNGQLDMDTVRALFIERGLMTVEEFDSALFALRSNGYISTVSPTPNGIKEFERIMSLPPLSPVDTGATSTSVLQSK